MSGTGNVPLAADDGSDRRGVSTVRERIRARGERVCHEQYQEAVRQLEADLGRPLDRVERAALAQLAGRLGSALLAGPLQALSTADDPEATAAERLFTDE